MMQTVTREQALAGTLALVNPAHPLQARPAPEALVPAMPDAPGVLLARQAAVMLAALLDGIRAAAGVCGALYLAGLSCFPLLAHELFVLLEKNGTQKPMEKFGRDAYESDRDHERAA